jgi:hypothetical protein
MGFVPSRQRHIVHAGPARIVLAVGQRAFVHSPADVARTVLLTNERGIPGDCALRDGTEVEIVGWRPRGQSGTRYRVCDRADGSDGWLAAEELRTTASRPEPDPAVTPPRPSGDPYGRRFGSGS